MTNHPDREDNFGPLVTKRLYLLEALLVDIGMGVVGKLVGSFLWFHSPGRNTSLQERSQKLVERVKGPVERIR